MRRIKEFPSYSVTVCGKVWSHLSNQYMAPQNNGNGYFKITLRKEGRGYQRYIHRLVAETYCKKRKGCNEVDHINGIKDDNRAENLRWVSRSENARNYRGSRYSFRSEKLIYLTDFEKQLIEIMYVFGDGITVISNNIDRPRQTVYSYIKRVGLHKSEINKEYCK